MPGGNLHLPRLGTRGVAAPERGTKIKRQPTRYAVADRKAELAGPAVETLRSPLVCEPLDVSDYPVAARAVAAMRTGTCKRPFGPMEHLSFCGAKATVVVAGALTYCPDCAKAMGFDLQAWQRAQDAARKHLGGKP